MAFVPIAHLLIPVMADMLTGAPPNQTKDEEESYEFEPETWGREP